jgi:hypothetical protein
LTTPNCSQTDLALGTAEVVDQVDRLSDLGELAPDIFAVDMLAGDLRVDRQHPVAARLEIGHHPVARPVRPVRRADHGDRTGLGEEGVDIFVAGEGHIDSIAGLRRAS